MATPIVDSLISEDGGTDPGFGEVDAALADIGEGYGVYLKLLELIGLRPRFPPLGLLVVVLLLLIPEEGVLFGD